MQLVELLWLVPLSFAISAISLNWMIPRLKAAGMSGKDVNKPSTPEVAEMGGLSILFAILVSALFVIALDSFQLVEIGSIMPIVVVLLSISFVGFVGIIDDLISMPQAVKALLPIIGSFPLVALKIAGSTFVSIPLLGTVDFGIFYFLAIIPLSITVSANLTNMLAGFNGLEYGMAIPMYAAALLLGLHTGSAVIVVFSTSMLGASAGFLVFNFSGKVFPGDIGTLLIGALLASILIAGNLESYAAVFAIYILEFIIKAANGFPSKGWAGTYKDGKLHCEKAVSLPQLVMKKTGGISERSLVLLFIGAQAIVCIAVAAIIYAPR